MGIIRALIADDHGMVAQGLKLLIERFDPEITVVGTAGNGKEALALCAELLPDVVLMDVRMPVMDGVEATRELGLAQPGVHVIMLTTFSDDEYVIGALRNGAKGYLLKDMPGEELVQAIRSVHNGCMLMSPSVVAKLVERFSADVAASIPVRDKHPVSTSSETKEPLAPREKEILELLVAGLENGEIAEKLHISEGTVRNYVSKIYEKLNIHGRVQAVLYMMRNAGHPPGDG